MLSEKLSLIAFNRVRLEQLLRIEVKSFQFMSLILKSQMIKALAFPVKSLHSWLIKRLSKLSLFRLLLGLRYIAQMVRLSILTPLTETISYSWNEESIIFTNDCK